MELVPPSEAIEKGIRQDDYFHQIVAASVIAWQVPEQSGYRRCHAKWVVALSGSIQGHS